MIFNMTGGGNGGSNGVWNIYCQTTEPTTEEGLWIKSNAATSVHIGNLETADGTRETASVALPNTIANGMAAAVNGIAYLLGGCNQPTSNTWYRSIYAYDPATGILTTKSGTLAEAVSEACVATVNGVIYLLGGRTGAGTMASRRIQAYDPATDVCTTKTATLASASYGGSGCAINGLIYVFGGYSGITYQSMIQSYDPATDMRTTLSVTLSSARLSTAAAAVGTVAYIFGGNPLTNVIQAYDTTSGIISTKEATLATSSCFLSAVAVTNSIYLFGGNNTSTTYYNTIQVYNTITDSCTTATATLSSSMGCTASVAIAGTAYIFGGRSVSVGSSEIQTYSIATNHYATGTAIVVVDVSSDNVVPLYSTPTMDVELRVNEALLQEASGLHHVDAAYKTTTGNWVTI